MRKHLHVVCAVIQRDGEVLVCQRNSKTLLAGKWEFPGGKIEHGESADEALCREIEEELAVSITIRSSLSPVHHSYTDFDISLFPFVCEIAASSDLTEPVALEHAQICWMAAQEASALDWAEADIPILRQLLQLLDKS